MVTLIALFPPLARSKRVPGRALVAPADAEAAGRLPTALRDLLQEDGKDGDGEGEGNAVAFYEVEDGHIRLGVNAEFERRLMGAVQACAFVEKHAMLPDFLWGWCVLGRSCAGPRRLCTPPLPDDSPFPFFHTYTPTRTPTQPHSLFTAASQQALYQQLSQALFCGPGDVGEVTLLLECVDRVGQPFHGLTKVRATCKDGGAYAACALSIKPLPPTFVVPGPQLVGLSLLSLDRPQRRPAVKQEPKHKAKEVPELEQQQQEQQQQPLLFPSPIKAECPDGAACCSSSTPPSTASRREWAGGARARRPSIRAREGDGGEDEEDDNGDNGSLSSVSTGSGWSRSRSKSKSKQQGKKRRRTTTTTTHSGGEMHAFPFLPRCV